MFNSMDILERELNLDTKTHKRKGLGMIFMPNNESKIKESKIICDEEAKKLTFKETFWRNVPIKNETLGILAKANAPFINQWIVCLEKDDSRDIEMLLFQLRKRIEKRIRDNTKKTIGECEFYFASPVSYTHLTLPTILRV